MSDQTVTEPEQTDNKTDAQRFEEGVKTLFRAPKKAVMERIEAEKRERKEQRIVKQKQS